jgi:hypothetical protein
MINYWNWSNFKIHIMGRSLLKEFVLQSDLQSFLSEFWISKTFYESFLIEKLEDLNVDVEEWVSETTNDIKTRNVRSFHPSKVSFPGLPSHAEVFKLL